MLEIKTNESEAAAKIIVVGVGCGLLLERDLDLVGCFGGNEVALCVCHALWTPIAAGSPYGLL